MAKRKTQREKLLARLGTGHHLTVSEARNRLGIQRLAARIFELREEGFEIFTNKVRSRAGANNGKIVTAYKLQNPERYGKTL